MKKKKKNPFGIINKKSKDKNEDYKVPDTAPIHKFVESIDIASPINGRTRKNTKI